MLYILSEPGSAQRLGNGCVHLYDLEQEGVDESGGCQPETSSTQGKRDKATMGEQGEGELADKEEEMEGCSGGGNGSMITCNSTPMVKEKLGEDKMSLLHSRRR